MSTNDPIRILIADDNKAVRDVLALIIEAEPDLTVAGIARDGREAVRLCQQFQPDVALLDLGMPHLRGDEATLQIRAAGLPTRIVLFSNADPVGLRNAARHCQPDAVLRKETLKEIVTVIRGLVAAPPPNRE
ncbi:MAG: hypothetical protein Kow0077_32360 [Anaerolineae bacterium]